MAFRNEIRRLSQLVADSITGATITGGLIQTAASGLRMWMQAQVGSSFEGLFFSSGLGAQSSPGQVILRWDTPVGVPDATTNTVGVEIDGPEFGQGHSSIVLNSPVKATSAAAAISLNASTILANGLLDPTQLKMLGAVINGIDFGGNASATTGSGGGFVVNHNLGVIPLAILAIPFASSNSMMVHVGARTSTNFTLQFSNSTTGAALASTVVGFYWIALA